MEGSLIPAGVRERRVAVADAELRVWEKGAGAAIVVLPGFGGAARWSAFMDRLAVKRRVIVPSLPGFPGGGRAHERLDSQLDWILAARDVVIAAVGPETRSFDLMGISVGGALAAEVAALWPALIRRLVLAAPYGVFDAEAPSFDIFAVKPGTGGDYLCADPKTYAAHIVAPDGVDALEWDIMMVRANEAAARILWPLGDTGLVKRLGRIMAPTLIAWGETDRVMPRSYADRFAAAIGGKTTLATIPGAGHLADLDAPDALADAVLAHCG